MTNRSFAMILIVLLAGSGVAFAQARSDAEQFYSSGVQAFHAQRFAEAIGFFDRIEGLGTQDPRAFFFRGLAHSRLGNTAAATADYETAARMELTVAGRSYSVPRALERIQGRERTVIEQHRRAAKRAWDAEQNVRRQEEFLSQKAEDMKFFQAIIASGQSGASSPQAVTVSSGDTALPFGAQPVTPFVVNPQTFRSSVQTDVSQSRLTDDNPFKADVEHVTVVVPTEDVSPRTPLRPQDPSERGIFDFESDDAQGFDVDFRQPGSISAPRNPFGGLGLSAIGNGRNVADDDDFSSFGGGDFDRGDVPSPRGGLGDGGWREDDHSMAMPGGVDIALGAIISEVTSVPNPVNPLDSLAKEVMTKENGTSFGKGFASLFKKSGGSGASSGTPTAPSSHQESTFNDFGDDDTTDPFAADPFDDF
jgi:hypothetical protein